MSLIAAWVLFPILMIVISLGCGLALDRASGARLPWVLLVPSGLAVVMLAALMVVAAGGLRTLVVVVVLAIAAIGFWFGAGRLRGARVCFAALLVAACVFLAYGAPVLFSGEATLAGYIQLDDDSTFLALNDQVLEHGRSTKGLPQSTYEATVQINLDAGYPVGSLLPVGIAQPLLGTDSIWLYQPYLAYLAAMLALCLWWLLASAIATAWKRGVIVFVAAQPAITYAYAMQGGVKEMVAFWLVGLMAALGMHMLREQAGPRSALPLAVATGALVASLDFGGGAWAAPMVIAVAIAAIASRGRVRLGTLMPQAGVLVLAAGVFTAIALEFSGFLSHSNLTVLENDTDLGNLGSPLSRSHIFGVWPTGDHRTPLGAHAGLVHLLWIVMAFAAAAGVVELLRRRSFAPLVYIGGALGGWVLVSAFGGAWVDGKALATASAAVVLAALLGAVALGRLTRPIVSIGLVMAIAFGVLYSNLLTYRDVNLAPRDRLHEAQRIGERFAGEGPTLDNEYEPYVERHLLRKMDPEGPSELRRRNVLLNNGTTLPKGGVADLDLFRTDQLLIYRTIVVPRGPSASRPPSPYQRIWHGRYYDVWQRPAQGRYEILERVSGGDYAHAAGPIACPAITAIAKRAAPGDRLIAAARATNVVMDPLSTIHPPQWGVSSAELHTLYLPPKFLGAATGAIEVPAGGRFDAWLGGSFARGMEVRIDGRRVGDAKWQLRNGGLYIHVGTVALRAGRHVVELRREGAFIHPGPGSRYQAVGPLSLDPRGATERERLVTVVAGNARSLCGRSLDWVERVRGASRLGRE